MRIALALIVVLIAGCATQTSTGPQPGAQYGSVASSGAPIAPPMEAPAKCLSLVDVNNKNTPAELLRATRNCIDTGNYAAAADLYVASSAFASFDIARVGSKSAQQVIPELQTRYLKSVSTEQRSAFTEAVTADLQPNSPQLAGICSRLKSIGAPAYTPDYMLQYAPGSALQADFNGDYVWKTTLTGYMNCSP